MAMHIYLLFRGGIGFGKLYDWFPYVYTALSLYALERPSILFSGHDCQEGTDRLGSVAFRTVSRRNTCRIEFACKVYRIIDIR